MPFVTPLVSFKGVAQTDPLQNATRNSVFTRSLAVTERSCDAPCQNFAKLLKVMQNYTIKYGRFVHYY